MLGRPTDKKRDNTELRRLVYKHLAAVFQARVVFIRKCTAFVVVKSAQSVSTNNDRIVKMFSILWKKYIIMFL